jgi:succinyl-CoA synthetase beta subunit
MKIHEYQAMELFSRYSIPVPDTVLCRSVADIEKKIPDDGKPKVIKAQVLTGGRGKAGGVKIAGNRAEAIEIAGQMLGMNIKGLTVDKVLVADAVEIEREFYAGLINDRNAGSVTLMVCTEGGVEIEEVARLSPEKIIKISIDPLMGLMDWQARKMALNLFGDPNQIRKTAEILVRLYRLYSETDATLAEINPLVLTTGGQLLALDGKMNFDDNALFRQPEIFAMREIPEDEKKEAEANEKGLSYIQLEGNIGCMVNGAGLAMTTMDLIKIYGGEPANFLDIGGSSSPQKVIDAMDILLSDKNVKSVMINIFGGITRCDDVARGLVDALKQINTDIPVVIRLSGTNAEEGKSIISAYGLPVVSTMSQAAKIAIELSKKHD